jgi:hypothetical protein
LDSERKFSKQNMGSVRDEPGMKSWGYFMHSGQLSSCWLNTGMQNINFEHRTHILQVIIL